MRVVSRIIVVAVLSFVVFSVFMLPAIAYLIESDWAADIEDYATRVDADTRAEIVVYLVPSLIGHGITDKQGNEINGIVDLGVYIFNDMSLETLDGTQVGIGKAGKDNGVLILVALDDHQWRIEVGYGLEGDITDVESNRIAQDNLVPMFQQGNYGEGLYDTVVALGNEIPSANSTKSSVRGYYYYESKYVSPPEDWYAFWTWNFYGLPLWLMLLLVLLGIFVPVFRGRRGRGGGSGGGGSTGRW